ncbi:rhamnogalacturonan lyase [Belliella kenyensis]|uniref:Rhamnogalacturonan lyase n=1 Tax=Belliella kenyensis TaxID=1472724 RepID=A0ABV8EEY2_9BACT|nr:rhamnogalacturonan lyase [Belliella kenyensis]MCH7401857.1 rhamnogalacturonan lyase [Belliella kenyensis]MDN3604357.1 rhamnogalacturonan lyase [Belliella kenyensis]
MFLLKQSKPFLFLLILVSFSLTAYPQDRQMEYLDRGLVAIQSEDGVFVSWRQLGTEPDDIGFNLYRIENDEQPVKVNSSPIKDSNNYLDTSADPIQENSYYVTAIIDGQEVKQGEAYQAWDKPYLSIPLRTPEGYHANDASVGDLTGDGRYEIVVHMLGSGKDNSQKGITTAPILQAYTLEGEFLWEINLGKNIREGAHYTQFMVYDLDGDGRAEVACKTADGTIDGKGKIIGDANADHRNADGYILKGSEFFTVFDGLSGAALATTDYVPARHPDIQDPSPDEMKEIWGDGYGNRIDRFLAGIAYLDGEKPSLILSRGYYTRTVISAWNWRGGELSHVWTFDSHGGDEENRKYAGQGYHSLTIADVDNDGKDEVVFGSMVINHDGKGLYSSGLGHGDAMHVSNMNPNRKGMEIFGIHENARHPHGANLRDALTGEIIWSYPSKDVGRGLAIDIDPRHDGFESWASGDGLKGLWNIHGEIISEVKPSSCNMAIWWDGDLLREILDGVNIDKWDYENSKTVRILSGADFNLVKNNGTKSNPNLSADIFGDWREELITRTEDGKELRIFSTTIPTKHRIYTLMHNPQYRMSIAWQNVAYNQPPHTDYFFGHGMEKPKLPAIKTIKYQGR